MKPCRWWADGAVTAGYSAQFFKVQAVCFRLFVLLLPAVTSMHQTSAQYFSPSALITAATLALLFGCSRTPRNVAPVTGKVTLGGQPLADALITFSPAAGGSPSSGRSNANGEYELTYSRDVMGAEKGEHTVMISTFVAGNPDGDPPTTEVPEKVPFAYREGNKVPKATVDSGKNEINFDLEAGPVNPPPSKGRKKSTDSTCY